MNRINSKTTISDRASLCEDRFHYFASRESGETADMKPSSALGSDLRVITFVFSYSRVRNSAVEYDKQ